MPVNGHTASSQTVFSPRQNGHSNGYRIPVTASAPLSAVRPAGLSVPHRIVNGDASAPGAVGEGERAAEPRWQDKAVLRTAPPASSQPGPDTKVARSSMSDTGSPRSQNDSLAKERLVKGAVWMKPGVKEALASLAEQNGLSFSATAAKGLEVYARATMHDQQEELFEPKMRTMLRREIRASDNRHVPFEIKNAIAAEQTRILIADLYKRQLRKEGMPLKEINKKLDEAYNLARSNVLNTKTPKFKNLLAAWWQTTEEQDDGSQKERTATGEAGTGKSKA